MKKVKFDLHINIIRFIAIFFLCGNVVFWFFCTKSIVYDFTITPYPPSRSESALIGFGDNALAYRILGSRLQFAGDAYGQTTPLNKYDYKKLQKWFYALDALDPISELVPAIAGNYYSFSQNPLDNQYIVPYLENFGKRNPIKNWRWLLVASDLSSKKLKDYKKSMDLAKIVIALPNIEEIPYWARIASVFVAKEHEPCEMFEIIALLKKNDFEKIVSDQIFSINNGQHNYIADSIIQRIEKLTKDPKLIQRCLNERKQKGKK